MDVGHSLDNSRFLTNKKDLTSASTLDVPRSRLRKQVTAQQMTSLGVDRSQSCLAFPKTKLVSSKIKYPNLRVEFLADAGLRNKDNGELFFE